MLQIGATAWKGRAHEDLEEMGERLFEEKIADLVYPEARELVRAHHDRGHAVVLSSSATEYQVEPVARYLGVDRVLCNRYGKRDGVLTGEIDRPVIWGPTKADAVQQLAAEQGVDLGRSYFYADGDEDTALMYLVGTPVRRTRGSGWRRSRRPGAGRRCASRAGRHAAPGGSSWPARRRCSRARPVARPSVSSAANGAPR